MFISTTNVPNLSAAVVLGSGGANAGDRFGTSIACAQNGYGSFVAVGAPGYFNTGGVGSGAVYIYTVTGQLVGGAAFTPPPLFSARLFGTSVSIFSNTIAVGAEGAVTNDDGEVAVCYFTANVVPTALGCQILAKNPASANGRFGHAVSLSSAALLAVSAPNWKNTNPPSGANQRGIVYLYRAALTQAPTLNPTQAPSPNVPTLPLMPFSVPLPYFNPIACVNPSDLCGWSVSLEADPMLAVGAPGGNYVLFFNNILFSQQFLLFFPPSTMMTGTTATTSSTISSSTSTTITINMNMRYGNAVGITQSSITGVGEILAVGAPSAQNFAGAAFVYNTALGPSDNPLILTGQGRSTFGYALAISGSMLVVGGPFTSYDTGCSTCPDAGSGYITLYQLLYASGVQPVVVSSVSRQGSGKRALYGTSVALLVSTSISAVAVGSPGFTNNNGTVFVYFTSGSRLTLALSTTTAFSVNPPNQGNGSFFGWSVDLAQSAFVGSNANFLAVASPYFSGPKGFIGEAFLYKFTPAGATALIGSPILPPAAPGFSSKIPDFGIKVKLSGGVTQISGTTRMNVASTQLGGTLAVGIPHFGNAASSDGEVLLFPFDNIAVGNSASQVFSDSFSVGGNAQFGRGLDLKGNLLAIGEPGYNSNAGQAFVFAQPVGITGISLAAPPPPAPISTPIVAEEGGVAPFSLYGNSVDLYGTELIVGAPAFPVGSLNAQEYVKFYYNVLPPYFADATISLNIPRPTGVTGTSIGTIAFGFSVACAETLQGIPVLAVGSPGYSSFAGAVFLFDPTLGEGGAPLATLTNPNQNSGPSTFGYAIALSRNFLLVGAPYDVFFTGNRQSGIGQVFLYSFALSGSSYSGSSLPAALTVSASAAGTGFGTSVALFFWKSSSLAAVGAPFEGTTGVVYLYTTTILPYSPSFANQVRILPSTLNGLNVGSWFGFSISLGYMRRNGFLLLIGAPLALANDGLVHLYSVGNNNFNNVGVGGVGGTNSGIGVGSASGGTTSSVFTTNIIATPITSPFGRGGFWGIAVALYGDTIAASSIDKLNNGKVAAFLIVDANLNFASVNINGNLGSNIGGSTSAYGTIGISKIAQATLYPTANGGAFGRSIALSSNQGSVFVAVGEPYAGPGIFTGAMTVYLIPCRGEICRVRF